MRQRRRERTGQRRRLARSALLRRRLEQSRNGHLDARIAAGDFARERLREFVDIHGVDNPTHTYWLFPVRCADKDQLVADLHTAGFDATSDDGAISTDDTTYGPNREKAGSKGKAGRKGKGKGQGSRGEEAAARVYHRGMVRRLQQPQNAAQRRREGKGQTGPVRCNTPNSNG